MLGKRRALNLMKRFLDGETLTSKQVRRWEIADLLSMGFRVQGEQSFGDMAGAGLTHYWAMREYEASNRAAYEELLHSTPKEIIERHKRNMKKVESMVWLACALCGAEMQPQTGLWVNTSDGRYPLCRQCAEAACRSLKKKHNRPQPNPACSGRADARR